MILETKNLSKAFGGVRAIDRLSLGVETSEITAIIGPNGSGKSTLVNVLSGFLPMDHGAVVISGVELHKILPYEVPAYGITRTFQEVRLFNQMAVLDNVLVALTERNLWSAFFERHSRFHLERAEELLKKIGLWDKRRALAKNLSYGQRKLLEIARALAMDAKIYLFDEPFAGLFPEMAKVVAEVIRDLRNREKAVVLIEHDMGLIRELADYVFVLDGGELLAQGKPDQVLKQREVIEAYLGE